jgi:hypothetical protein
VKSESGGLRRWVVCVYHTDGTFYRVSHLALFFLVFLSRRLFFLFRPNCIAMALLFFLVGWLIGYGESCVGIESKAFLLTGTCILLVQGVHMCLCCSCFIGYLMLLGSESIAFVFQHASLR